MNLSELIKVLSTLRLPRYEEELKETVLFLQRVETSAGLSNRVCCSCNKEAVEDYMLTDIVWLEVCPEKDKYLCLSCVEKTLGRDLHVLDFKPLRMNSVAYYFLKKIEKLERSHSDFVSKVLKCETE